MYSAISGRAPGDCTPGVPTPSSSRQGPTQALHAGPGLRPSAEGSLAAKRVKSWPPAAFIYRMYDILVSGFKVKICFDPLLLID